MCFESRERVIRRRLRYEEFPTAPPFSLPGFPCLRLERLKEEFAPGQFQIQPASPSPPKMHKKFGIDQPSGNNPLSSRKYRAEVAGTTILGADVSKNHRAFRRKRD